MLFSCTKKGALHLSGTQTLKIHYKYANSHKTFSTKDAFKILAPLLLQVAENTLPELIQDDIVV
jgi:hypothetical protein